MILAIDTSCYTTSAALMSFTGSLVADTRRVLDVPLGNRGLSQSEALFQHIRNLPQLMEELSVQVDFGEVKAIGVSTRPRPLESSYMPVFLGGLNTARTLAAALQVPMYSFSHQEGHMGAALFSTAFKPLKHFLMCHFSGGTSELCLAGKAGPGSYSLELVSYSGDLHAGQFVDRIGVALGLPFPAGKHLEAMAANIKVEVPVVKTHLDKNGVFSFSGPETALQRLIAKGLEPAAAARSAEETVARTLKKALTYAMEKTGVNTVVLAGGVMSNRYIAAYLQKKLPRADLYFAAPDLASDNAVGVAYLALEKCLQK